MVKISSDDEPAEHADASAEKHAAVIIVIDHVRERHVASQQTVSYVDEDAVHAQL